jgi:hypothetical protein
VVIHRSTIRLAPATLVLLISSAWPAFADQAAMVTFLKGAAEYRSSESAPWRPLQKSTPVHAGHTIRTGGMGYVELTLPDGSFLRLAPDTLFTIDTSFFPENKPRRFTARLLLGRLWARVTRAVGLPGGRFRTATTTAVAGVRGTTYDLRTTESRGTDIWVYDGKVAVGPVVFEQGGPRKEVAWPQEVTEQQWEEIILGKLQKLHIGTDGKPGKPTAFEPDKEEDEWTVWNLQRDLANR